MVLPEHYSTFFEDGFMYIDIDNLKFREECKLQTDKFSGAVFKSFTSLRDAENFVNMERNIEKDDESVSTNNKNNVLSSSTTQKLNKSKVNEENKSTKTNLKEKESSSQNYVVVYTDGACEGNGTPTARAGYGVYFGPNDPRHAAAVE